MTRIFLILLMHAISAPALGQVLTPDQLSDEDRRVLLVALANHKPDNPALLLDSTMVVCDKEPQGPCVARRFLDEVPSDAWETDRAALLGAFTTRNEKPWALGDLDVGLSMAPGSEIRAYFAKGRMGWREVGERYPGVGHLVQVSAPAYSSDGQWALVYVETLCIGRCGYGWILLLERRADRWLVRRNLVNWIG